jgi:hypothetical protein
MTIQTIRPNSQLAFSGITGTGGTSYVLLSDNSNGTYVIGTVNDGYLQMGWDDISILSTQRVRSCRIKIKNAAESVSPGRGEPMLARIVSGSTFGGYAVGAFTTTRYTSTIADQYGPYAYTAPGGRAWSGPEVNAIASWMQWYQATDKTGTFQRVYEAYIEVDVNGQPTITGAPTISNTASSQPTVSWFYLDPDGDIQTAYQVKIFNSAQYGAVGFNPDTSVAVINQTVLNSAATSFTPSPGVLAGGATYKAYVRAAQAWPGPQGKYWWSDWAISSPFSLVTIPPPTPSMTVATLTDSVAARALIDVDSPINQLDINQASFEVNISTWAADTNMAAPTRSTTDAGSGIGSMTMSSSAAGDMIAKSGAGTDASLGVNGGDVYTSVVSFHAAVSARSCQAGIRWFNVAGGTISTIFGSSVTDSASAGVYTQAQLVGSAAPTNAVRCEVVAKVLATGGAAEVHRIDKAGVWRGSSTTWSAGGESGSQAVIIERGERVDTHRGPGLNWAHPQVASGGSVTRDNGHGFAVDRTQDLIAFQYLDKVIAGRNTPTGMILWQPRTAAVNKLIIGGGFYYPEWEWNFPIVYSQLHIFSCWAWVKSGTFTTTPHIEFLNDPPASGSVASTLNGTQVTLTTTPQRIVMTGTAPASGVSFARGTLTNDGSSSSASVYVTKIGWGLGTRPLDDEPPLGGDISWYEARDFAAEQFPTGNWPFQIRTLADFEAPPARPVIYRAHTEVLADDGVTQLTSGYPAYIAAYVTPPSVSTLRSIPDPQQGIAVNRRMATSYVRVQDSAIFHPLGRNESPVQRTDWVGGEDGQLIVLAPTEQQNALLERVLGPGRGGTFLVQWAQGGATAILITDQQISEVLTETNWCDVDGNPQPDMRMAAHVLTYVETARP